MRLMTIGVAIIGFSGYLAAQDRPPIIDVHLHALAEPLGFPVCPRAGILEIEHPDGTPVCDSPLMSPQSAHELRERTLEAMRRHNIIGVLSGSDISVVEVWRALLPKQVIPALQTTGLDVEPG